MGHAEKNMITRSFQDPWIVRPRPNANMRLRLFCFPYAGGGASLFRKWPDSLPPTVEVCAVQLPGRENRLVEPLFDDVERAVGALVGALRPYLDRPFAFFGHSMGALLAFALARELREQRLIEPAHLFVSGRRAPQTPARFEPIHHLPEADFVAELRRYNGTPELILRDAELRRLFLPILRMDFALAETYTYIAEAPLACPISAFGGLQDEIVNHAELEAWAEQTRAAFSLRMLEGDHFFVNSCQELLLHAIAEDLRPLLTHLPRSEPQ
jgi:medium-chain acyl-[acyl-carrier-protein] hydrolase